MRLFVLALVSSLAAVALTATTSSAVAAGPTLTAIVGDPVVTAGGTELCQCTGDPTLFRDYTVSFDFTHRGPVVASVYEVESPDATTALGPPFNAMYRGTGADSYTSTVCGGVVGQTVYFRIVLYKYGGGLFRPARVLDSMTVGPYNS